MYFTHSLNSNSFSISGSVNGHSLCILERVLIFLHWAGNGPYLHDSAKNFNCSYGVIEESIVKVINALNANTEDTESFTTRHITLPEGEEALDTADWIHWYSGFVKWAWGAIGKSIFSFY